MLEQMPRRAVRVPVASKWVVSLSATSSLSPAPSLSGVIGLKCCPVTDGIFSYVCFQACLRCVAWRAKLPGVNRLGACLLYREPADGWEFRARTNRLFDPGHDHRHKASRH